jgi:hypothetical protein
VDSVASDNDEDANIKEQGEDDGPPGEFGNA